MPVDHVSRKRNEWENQMKTRTLLRRLVLFGVPLILGGLEIVHPIPGTSGIVATLSPQINWWLTLHLFTTGLPGWVPTISRIGVWFFFVFYLALDSIAGIANVIIRTAQALPPSQIPS